MQVLLTKLGLYMYNVNALLIILLKKCIENWEEEDSLWLRDNASMTDGIGLLYKGYSINKGNFFLKKAK